MSLLESTRCLVAAAGTLILEQYGKVAVELKADHSVVTAADRTAEDFLRRGLLELLPDAAYIGEETARDEAGVEAARRHEYIWVVDPLDGTAAFCEGIETFGVSVGLLHRGFPMLGVVRFPALKHEYQAEGGRGAFCDRQPATVLDAAPTADRSVLYVDAKAHLKYDLTHPGKTRSLGSTALHNLLVARGAAVGALSTAHIWDYVGAAAVLREAGGRIAHLDGTEVAWLNWLGGANLTPPVLTAPPTLWEELAAGIRPRPNIRLDS